MEILAKEKMSKIEEAKNASDLKCITVKVEYTDENEREAEISPNIPR